MVNVGISRARQLCIFIASEDEVAQLWMEQLVEALAPRVLRRVGPRLVWEEARTELKQEHLFSAQLLVADVATNEVPASLPPAGTTLGAQIEQRRALRPLLSREQRLLVDRDLSDAGPRVVRGVAGSGKTLILAHWAVRALRGLQVHDIVIVFANAALEPLLRRMLADAWKQQGQGGTPFPWDRVHLVHIRTLLSDLRGEIGLDPPAETHTWDYEHQARTVLEATTPKPRFDAVLIDEAQDLGHDPMRLVTSLVKPTRDGRLPVMVFYDNAQNVYDRKTPRWADFGIETRGRSDVMRESFRSTRQCTELALNVVHRLHPLDRDASMRELIKPRSGPPLLCREDRDGLPWWRADFCSVDGHPPEIRLYGSFEEECSAVAEQVERWLTREEVRPGDIRIIVPKKRLAETIREVLAARMRGRKFQARTSRGFEGMGDVVVVSTPHSFKGYDAEIVVAMAADAYHIKGAGPRRCMWR